MALKEFSQNIETFLSKRPISHIGCYVKDPHIFRSAPILDYSDQKTKLNRLTGFFNPQGFLTAMRQETTRANAAKGDLRRYAINSVTRIRCKVAVKRSSK